jgi:hypothetical protein
MKLEKACVYSLNAYNRLYPSSFFRRKLQEKDIKEAKKSIVFLGFCKLAHLAKEKKDYFVILKIIEQDVEGVCCMLMVSDDKQFSQKFLKAKKNADPKLLEKFEKYYKEEEREK